MRVSISPSASLFRLELVGSLVALLRHIAESIILAVSVGGASTGGGGAAEKLGEMTVGNGLEAGETGADDSGIDFDQAVDAI